MTWQDAAPCRGLTHLFFAPLGESAVTRRTRVAKAQAICLTCPYQRECAEASRDQVGGIWNGVDLDEPMLIRRRMAAKTRRALPPINHGSPGGWKAHNRRGEPACESCIDARRRSQRTVVKEWRRRQRGAITGFGASDPQASEGNLDIEQERRRAAVTAGGTTRRTP